jgi:hypothetical protein
MKERDKNTGRDRGEKEAEELRNVKYRHRKKQKEAKIM